MTASKIIIIGLGNPGEKYQRTRHNTGFMVLDLLSSSSWKKNSRCQASICSLKSKGKDIILAKPLTFMNKSGLSVSKLKNYYRINTLENIWVVYDDLDLPLGKIRIRPQGRPGGHNGIASIIEQLGTDQFPHFRLGISNKQIFNSIDYVLSKFNSKEKPIIQEALKEMKKALLFCLEEGLEKTMNKFN